MLHGKTMGNLCQTYFEKYSVVSDILPEAIAVKAGVKRVASHVTRLRENMYERIQHFCQKMGLLVDHTDYRVTVMNGEYKNIPFDAPGNKTNDTVYAFIARNSADLRQISALFHACDEFQNFGQDGNEKIGKMLGFPKCCVDAFNEVKGFGRNAAQTSISSSSEFSFYLNNFHWGSPFYLISHFPCSYSCKHSISFAKGVFKAVEKFDNVLASQVNYFLRMPILYLDFYVSVTFLGNYYRKGKTEKIVYSDFSLPDYTTLEDFEFRGLGDPQLFQLYKELLSKVIVGNCLIRDNHGIRVFRDDKQIGKLSGLGGTRILNFR